MPDSEFLDKDRKGFWPLGAADKNEEVLSAKVHVNRRLCVTL